MTGTTAKVPREEADSLRESRKYVCGGGRPVSVCGGASGVARCPTCSEPGPWQVK